MLCWNGQRDRRVAAMLAAVFAVFFVVRGAQADENSAAKDSKVVAKNALTWQSDFGAALRKAEAEGKMLLVYFHEADESPRRTAFETRTLADDAVRDRLGSLVLVKLPLDATTRSGGKRVTLLEHASFSEMNGRPGCAIVDVVHKESAEYKRVVKTVRFDETAPVGAREVLAAVDAALPAEKIAEAPAAPLEWKVDYAAALRQAESQSKPLFIYFHESESNELGRDFERRTLGNGTIRKKLARFVLARLPTNATIRSQGLQVKLLEHGAFEPMYGRQGIAIVDTERKDAPTFKQVVSAFPFSERRQYDAETTSVILDLPPGSLTQRTMIFAVRTHGESPESTSGAFDAMLASEAESHSQYQADINNQGHHNWGTRFQRIVGRLPGGMGASEVCAESWPGQELVDAACECVHSWRQSSGHWSAVRARQPFFGYDIKLGSGRVWYATGIFGRN